MSLSSHLQELKRKHQSLSDAVDITDLKKQKLRLKEEIERLST